MARYEEDDSENDETSSLESEIETDDSENVEPVSHEDDDPDDTSILEDEPDDEIEEDEEEVTDPEISTEDLPPYEPAAPGVESPPVRYVRLKDLYLEYGQWANPRKFTGLNDDSIDALAASIAAGATQDLGEDEDGDTYAGIQDPLKVVQVITGIGNITVVIDGQRRHVAATKAFQDDDQVLIPVRDLYSEPVELTKDLARELLKVSLRTVGTRAGLSSSELADCALRLRAGGETQSTIAVEIGKSESWVSKFLKALDTASPKLVARWRKGEITDEQFKDLASEKDPDKQVQATEAVVKARASGDKAEARTTAKETKEHVKAAKETKPAPAKEVKAKPAKGKGRAPVQTEMPTTPPQKPPSRAIVEDMLEMAKKNPPTHDYVKGLLDGVRWDRGMLDAGDFGKAWQAYLGHVKGDRKAPEAVKAKPAKKAAAKKGKKK